MSAAEVGRRGERLALRYLRRCGYRLVCRNYRHGRHEIDRILRDGDCLVFVEVKTRTNTAFGTPAMAVGRDKQRNLRLAAAAYLQQCRCGMAPARFDVVEVYLPEGKIQHIVNAFSG